MKNGFVHICFIIDSSGSMYGSIDEVKKGYATTIEQQLAITDGECAISMYTFAGEVKRELLGVDVKDAPKRISYFPNGSTSLFDAIGTAITDLDALYNDVPEEAKPEKMMIIIMTDGEENSSHIYTGAAVKEMIESHEKQDWSFMYLGAEVLNFEDAHTLGISHMGVTSRDNIGDYYVMVNSLAADMRDTSRSYLTKNAIYNETLESNINAINTEYTTTTGTTIN